MLTLNIQNENNQLDPYLKDIQREFEDCKSEVENHFNHDHLTVEVQVLAVDWVVDGMNIFGYAPSENKFQISMNPDNPKLSDKAIFHQEFLATLAHELHHCQRWSSIGYGETLLESMISEGLACQFETQVTGKQPVYVNHLGNQREELLNLSIPFWDQSFKSEEPYHHAYWFYGVEDNTMPTPKIPNWTGYDLGSYLVDEYFKKTGSNAVTACDVPAHEFCL